MTIVDQFRRENSNISMFFTAKNSQFRHNNKNWTIFQAFQEFVIFGSKWNFDITVGYGTKSIRDQEINTYRSFWGRLTYGFRCDPHVAYSIFTCVQFNHFYISVIQKRKKKKFRIFLENNSNNTNFTRPCGSKPEGLYVLKIFGWRARFLPFAKVT